MLRKRRPILAAVLAGLGMASTCIADISVQQHQQYAGSVCWTDNEGADIFYDLRGSLVNRSPFTVRVHCPVMHDFKSLGYVLVRTLRENPQSSFACTFWIRTPDGTPKHFQVLHDLASGLGQEGFNMPYIPNGIYALDCQVPGAVNGKSSRIRGIKAVEYNE